MGGRHLGAISSNHLFGVRHEERNEGAHSCKNHETDLSQRGEDCLKSQ
jgi:hypothetical protein